ncbi:unnamed protein product [Rhizoctonia solani]|uniref:Uncharacterized protein n=1 Tax=Rhizoctonia solani TaxID=456999 RepID=A0A8H3EA73_9AGAM|nr:unnamed protein product [Rhizoctonia solani]
MSPNFFGRALDKTVAAFTAAGGLNNQPPVNGVEYPVNGDLTNGISNGAVPNVSGEYNDSCEPLFDESIEEIKYCYDTMQIGDGSDLQKQLETARSKDQDRLKSYKARLTKFIPVQELVDLTLVVHDNDTNGPSFPDLHDRVLRSARLSYIKWLVTKELKGYEIIHFKDDIQKQTIHLDDKIEPLVEGNKCTINMLVRKKEPNVVAKPNPPGANHHTSTMASKLPPTSFYDLTSPKQTVEEIPYPATGLIYALLHHTGADVSSFRRNCQVSYRLVEYARNLYDGINSRIREAESSGSWESYHAYYRAIDPLEEVLLSIKEITDVEQEGYLIEATPGELAEQSIEAWISRSISDWHERRGIIRKHLDDLRTREGLKECISAT